MIERCRCFQVLAALLLGGLIVPFAYAFPKLPQYDVHGDRLPEGVVARFGTTKLRGDSRSVAFTADGKRLIGADGGLIRIWDAANGNLVETRQLPSGAQARLARSEDGQTLALATRTSVELWGLTSIKKIDLRMPSDLKEITNVAVSNDRRWMLIASAIPDKEQVGRGGGFEITEQNHRLLIWDTLTGRSRTLSQTESGIVWLGFSPDGKKCVSTGGRITKVWNTATGKMLWDVPDYNAEEMHFTPDSKHLIAAPGGGQSDWHIWDADSGKVATDLHPPKSGYVWMFAVSPDGKLLFVPNEFFYEVWDMKERRIRYRSRRLTQSGRGAFAPDGRSIVIHDTVFERRDLTTGKNLYTDVAPLGHTRPVIRAFFTPDGEHLISIGEDRTVRVWEVQTSNLIRTISLDSALMDAWAVSPDAKTLVGIDGRLTLHRWLLQEEKQPRSIELREARKLAIGLRAREIQISADGTLSMLAWPRVPTYDLNRFSFSFWETSTGKHLRWGGDPGRDYYGEYARMSPDGWTAASGDGLYDMRSGLKRTFPASPLGAGGIPTFSPDSRLLAASSVGIRVWEAATGRVLTDLPRGSGWSDRLAFSPDARRIACLRHDRLAIWDIMTGRCLVEYAIPDHSDQLPSDGAMVFSPSGRTLAVGLRNGTILLWKAPLPDRDESDRGDTTSQWNDIGGESPGNAYPAVWQLASRPAEAVRLLREKLPPVQPAKAEEWIRLIAALDSPRFAEREAASKRLRELGRAAVSHLRKTLTDKPSPEQTRRIEALLAELDPPPGRPYGDDLRAVRAVAILEACETEDARGLLREWAERGSSPRLAHEAAKAISRLQFGR